MIPPPSNIPTPPPPGCPAAPARFCRRPARRAPYLPPREATGTRGRVREWGACGSAGGAGWAGGGRGGRLGGGSARLAGVVGGRRGRLRGGAGSGRERRGRESGGRRSYPGLVYALPPRSVHALHSLIGHKLGHSLARALLARQRGGPRRHSAAAGAPAGLRRGRTWGRCRPLAPARRDAPLPAAASNPPSEAARPPPPRMLSALAGVRRRMRSRGCARSLMRRGWRPAAARSLPSPPAGDGWGGRRASGGLVLGSPAHRPEGLPDRCPPASGGGKTYRVAWRPRLPRSPGRVM